jgi:hypothetical protein
MTIDHRARAAGEPAVPDGSHRADAVKWARRMSAQATTQATPEEWARFQAALAEYQAGIENAAKPLERRCPEHGDAWEGDDK